MKWLIILSIFLLAIAYIAYRFRFAIMAAMQVWKMLRQIQQAGQKAQEKELPKKEKAINEALVRCASCGKWIAEGNAMNLRKNTFYCSANCVEKAVAVR